MAEVATVRSIDAPPQVVFDVISDIENLGEVNPNIVTVEFLTDSRTGVGTRFRETRRMGKREATTTLEITEHEAPNHLRIISDEGGTIWDTVFTVEERSGGSTLRVRMDIRPYRMLAKFMAPMAARMVQKAIEHDMDGVKVYCERPAD